MKDLLIFLLVTTAYLVIKSTLFSTVPLPDIPVLVAFYVAYTRPSIQGVLLCFAIGYIEDVFGGGILGSGSLTLVTIFIAVYLISKKVHFTSPALTAVAAAALTFIKGVILFALLSSINENVYFPFRIFIEAVITGAFAPAVFNIFDRLAAPGQDHVLER
ncbi:MAG: rod shape-determining protein MreD [Thermodesulfobacteriota bacterium]